jgi:hypothetical protein
VQRAHRPASGWTSAYKARFWKRGTHLPLNQIKPPVQLLVRSGIQLNKVWNKVWQLQITRGRCSQRAACKRGAGAGGPGHVLRPTLAGHRIQFARVAPSIPSVRAMVAVTANRTCARTPSHLPRHPGGRRRRGTPPRMHRAVVVPPGAGTIRGRPPWLQGIAVLMRLWLAVCDGRPRAWAGERGHRRRPAATTSAG